MLKLTPLGKVYEHILPYFQVEDVYMDKNHPVYKFRRDMVLGPKK